MVHPRFKVANEAERATFRSIRNHKMKHLKPDVGLHLNFGFIVNYSLSPRRGHDTGRVQNIRKAQIWVLPTLAYLEDS